MITVGVQEISAPRDQHSWWDLVDDPAPRLRLLMPPSTYPVSQREVRLYEAIQGNVVGWQRQIFDEYLPLVRGLLTKILGPQSEIEDLTSDVFVGLFESARNIRSADGLRSYVVSVAMNTARRELRRRRRRRMLFFWEDTDEMVERAPSSDDPKAKAALLQLSKLLATMPDEDRMVYALHVLEGLPLIEVAKTLDLSLSTTKRRLSRAESRMRKRVLRNSLLTDYVIERGGVLERGGSLTEPKSSTRGSLTGDDLTGDSDDD